MHKQFNTLALPYEYDALEPYIDAETMRIHHDKHHVAYTTKLNAALEKYPEWFEKSAEVILMDLNSIPHDVRTAVQNHCGGHVNHDLFWRIMGPNAGGKPKNVLLQAIQASFGSFEKFQEMFEEAAITQFGSGWAWLTVQKGTLAVEKTPNQNSPLSEGKTPILGLDVWEHAYYLKYKNMRQDYAKAFWNVVNWEEVEKNLAAVLR